MESERALAGTDTEEHSVIESNPRMQRPHPISREKCVEVLRGVRSPAAVEAETLVDIQGRYGIDRGIALAFFIHENSAGKTGIVGDYQTRHWRNLRRIQRRERGAMIRTRGGTLRNTSAGLRGWRTGAS